MDAAGEIALCTRRSRRLPIILAASSNQTPGLKGNPRPETLGYQRTSCRTCRRSQATWSAGWHSGFNCSDGQSRSNVWTKGAQVANARVPQCGIQFLWTSQTIVRANKENARHLSLGTKRLWLPRRRGRKRMDNGVEATGPPPQAEHRALFIAGAMTPDVTCSAVRPAQRGASQR